MRIKNNLFFSIYRKVLRRSSYRGCNISPSAILNINNGYFFLGEKSMISHFAYINTQKSTISVGKGVSIHAHCCLYGYGGIEIGNDVRIAAHTAIFSGDHNFANPNKRITEQGITAKKVIIGNDVWIGAGVKILPGTIIPDGCVIGASSVVKGELEPYGVYAGIPVRKIKSRN